MNKQFPKRQEPPQASVAVKLLTAGTAACWADFITFPLDTAKVRLQVSLVLRGLFDKGHQRSILIAYATDPAHDRNG